MALSKKRLSKISFRRIISVIFLLAALFGALYAINLYTGFFDLRKSASYETATLGEWTFNETNEGWNTKQFKTSEVRNGSLFLAAPKKDGKAGIFSPQLKLTLPKGNNVIKIKMSASSLGYDSKKSPPEIITVGVARGWRSNKGWRFKVFDKFEVPTNGSSTEYSVTTDARSLPRLGFVFYGVEGSSLKCASQGSIYCGTFVSIDNIKIESSLYSPDTTEEPEEAVYKGKIIRKKNQYYLRVEQGQKIPTKVKDILLVPTSDSVKPADFLKEKVKVTGYLTTDGWNLKFPTVLSEGTDARRYIQSFAPVKLNSKGAVAIFATLIEPVSLPTGNDDSGEAEIASPEPTPSNGPGGSGEPLRTTPPSARGGNVYDLSSELLVTGTPTQVSVKVKGGLPNPCYAFKYSITGPDASGKIEITVYSEVLQTFAACAEVIKPFDETISIPTDGLINNQGYTIFVNGENIGEFHYYLAD